MDSRKFLRDSIAAAGGTILSGGGFGHAATAAQAPGQVSSIGVEGATDFYHEAGASLI